MRGGRGGGRAGGRCARVLPTAWDTLINSHSGEAEGRGHRLRQQLCTVTQPFSHHRRPPVQETLHGSSDGNEWQRAPHAELPASSHPQSIFRDTRVLMIPQCKDIFTFSHFYRDLKLGCSSVWGGLARNEMKTMSSYLRRCYHYRSWGFTQCLSAQVASFIKAHHTVYMLLWCHGIRGLEDTDSLALAFSMHVSNAAYILGLSWSYIDIGSISVKKRISDDIGPI